MCSHPVAPKPTLDERHSNYYQIQAYMKANWILCDRLTVLMPSTIVRHLRRYCCLVQAFPSNLYAVIKWSLAVQLLKDISILVSVPRAEQDPYVATLWNSARCCSHASAFKHFVYIADITLLPWFLSFRRNRLRLLTSKQGVWHLLHTWNWLTRGYEIDYLTE